MKKVLYLHGLESGQGGPKVDYLADKCYVHAPEMDYTRKDIFPYLVQMMEDFDPDLIIGSSMGGYAAYMLGGFYNKPIIAFNPALHSRKFNPKFPIKAQNSYPGKAKIVLGEEDTIIDPKKTLEFITDQIGYGFPNIDIENVNNMGHRVPFDIFINKIQNEL